MLQNAQSKQDAPTKVRIFLKSGAVVEAVATNIIVSQDNTTGNFTALTWKNVANQPTLAYIKLEDVSAIVWEEREEIP